MPSIAETVDAASITRVHALHQTILVDYLGGTNAIYIGWGAPGSDPAAPVWRIARVTWDVNSNPVAVEWAAKAPALLGDNLYRHIWDDRATLTYS